MKHRILFILLFPLLFATCKRNAFFCTHPTEIKGQDHLVEISPLKAEPAMLELLKKNPQLQVAQIIDNEYALVAYCNIFYKGYIVFTSRFSMSRGRLYYHDLQMPDAPVAAGLNMDSKRTITVEAAIKMARKVRNFGKDCILYQEGFYDVNAFDTSKPHDYRFVYKITGKETHVTVVVDANSSEVLE